MSIIESLQSTKFPKARFAKFAFRGIDPSTDQIDRFLRGGSVNRKSCEWRPFSAHEPDLLKDISAASCLIMPSQVEAFGLIALEGIAAGVPVLVSSYSGIGMFLLQQDDVRRKIGNIEDIVLDVHDDAGRTAAIWVPAIERQLQDRTTAFERASRLREALMPIASWDAALNALELHLGKISGLPSPTVRAG
jgi:glycosyltransferase involved in cell wall biosynthesis